MKLNITYKLVVKDKGGKVVQELQTPGHSFVRQFLEVLYAQMTNQTITTVTDITGSDNSATGADVDHLPCHPAVGNNRGVTVGTGSTAVDISDNALAALIADGTASGQLTHGAQVITAANVTSQTAQFSIMRPFTNGSGGDIVVAEVGLQGNYETSSLHALLAREVLGSTVTIQNGQTIDVTATIQISAA